MSKYSQSETEYPETEVYEGTMDKSRKIKLTFRQNRSFELHIRKTVYSFAPYGSLEVDESVVNHPEFQQQKKYFLISEVR